MSQQINLLNPALIKQKDFLNPNNIAITLGLLSALMLGYYGYAQKQLSLLTMQRSQVAEALSATQAQLKQTALLHTPRSPDKTLQEQITQLEQKEIMQQQILRTVNQSSATPEKGYAALMRAFARQSLDGLWLTSFSFDSQTERLNISGRTLQAALVPEYIAHLGNEPALKGKLFSALNMHLPKADAASSNPATPMATQVSTASNSTSNNGTSTAPGVRQAFEPQYIEFVLQSTDEASVSGIENTKDEKKS
ncbi:MAG: MSHA biogenesis protein MshI [Methylotenera sp.]